MDCHGLIKFVPLMVGAITISVSLSTGWLPDAAYEPLVKKMRPADRMILRASGAGFPADLAELQRHYTVTGMWTGRVPPNRAADGTRK